MKPEETEAAGAVQAWAEAQRTKDLLRFITCGSVDDGKSTLIGRLLHDSHAIHSDQLSSVEAASRNGLDFSLLVDGLAAEREQGITIDVAYRFFATSTRKFIVADTPGHEQYTRNMVTGASTADAAVLLIDARKGVLTQTRRHAFLCKLLGIRHFILAVSKMDLVGYAEDVFAAISADFRLFADEIGLEHWMPIPVSGLTGDNVTAAGGAMPWFKGPSLLEELERIPVRQADHDRPFRMAVQLVVRPDQDFRGYAGQVSAGTIAPGSEVRILPSGRTTRVGRIVTADGDLDGAIAGQSVTLPFTDEVDCSRGNVVAAASDPPQAADQFEATIVWMAEEDLLPGRGYWLKLGTQTVTATVQQPKYEINVNSLDHLAARTLSMNGSGVAELASDRELVFEPYDDNRELGGFILIDKLTNATVAAGMIHFALRRALNVHRQHLEISRETHAALKGQRPAVLWFTGLSGAGKSTIANLVEKRLVALGRHTFLLDGDNVRHGLNRDLGFTDADRIENIRRIGEVARLMADAGLIVLTAFISPFRAEREMVRRMLPDGEFIEIFVDTPLAEAERRDPKGLYAKARAGDLKNFTGIDSPYEPPGHPEIRIDTTELSAEEAAERIVEALRKRT